VTLRVRWRLSTARARPASDDGMGRDGAEGLLRCGARGAVTLAQGRGELHLYGSPGTGGVIGAAGYILQPGRIDARVARTASSPRGRRGRPTRADLDESLTVRMDLARTRRVRRFRHRVNLRDRRPRREAMFGPPRCFEVAVLESTADDGTRTGLDLITELRGMPSHKEV